MTRMNRIRQINNNNHRRSTRRHVVILVVVVAAACTSISAFHTPSNGAAVNSRGHSLSSTNQLPYSPPILTSPPPQKRRRTKPQTAPLVDSTLLRFLSAQRTQISIEQMAPTHPTRPTTTTTNNYLPPTQQQQQPQQQQQLEEEIATVVRRAQDAAADSLAWFTDYNSHNIASRLEELGVPLDEATAAGNAVQNYVMAKTARKRIRKFLRDRDSVWLSDTTTTEDDDTEYEEDVPIIQRSATYRLSSFYEELPVWGRECSIEKVVETMCDRGLTGRDIAAVFKHTPSVSMMRVREEVEEEIEGEFLEDVLDRAYTEILCGSLKLRKYDARKVIRTCPNLLTTRGSSSASEVIHILSSLHVSPASLSRDKASLPILLSRSPAALFRLIAFLSGDGVRMPVDRIGPFIRRSECVGLLDRVAPIPKGSTGGVEEEEGVAPSMESLLNSAQEGVEAEIGRTYKQMYRTAIFLREEVGIDNVGKVMSAYPDILMTDVEQRIIPFFDFLCDDLGIDEEDVPKIIQAHPALLVTELEEMAEVREYLLGLGVDVESFPSIFRAFPSLLTLDIEGDMMPVVEFLRSIGVSNIGRFITRLPPVLGYSVENELQPKWEFLKNVCQYASFEVRRFPAYFSYPLDRVIMNRYEYLREIKGIPVRLLPVDEILRFGDADFSKVVAKDINGASYSQFIALRRSSKTKRKGSKKKTVGDGGNTSSRRNGGVVIEGNERSSRRIQR